MSAVNVLEEEKDIVGSTLVPESTLTPELFTNKVFSRELELSGTSATDISLDYTETDPDKLTTAYALSQLTSEVRQALTTIQYDLSTITYLPVLTDALASPTFTDLSLWTLRGFQNDNGKATYINRGDAPGDSQAGIKLSNKTFSRTGTHYLDLTLEHLPEGSTFTVQDSHGNAILTTDEIGRFKSTFNVDHAGSFYLEFLVDDVPVDDYVTISRAGVHYLKPAFSDYMDYMVEMMLSDGSGFVTERQLESFYREFGAFKLSVIETLEAYRNEIISQLTTHENDKNNPHQVTWEQTGAAAANHTHDYMHEPMIQEGILTPLAKLREDHDSLEESFEDHLTATNPHNLTPAIIGASPSNHTHAEFVVLEQVRQDVERHILDDTSNPHHVTCEMIDAAHREHQHSYEDISNLDIYTNDVKRAYTNLISTTKTELSTKHQEDINALRDDITDAVQDLTDTLNSTATTLNTRITEAETTLNNKINTTKAAIETAYQAKDTELTNRVAALERTHEDDTAALSGQIAELRQDLTAYSDSVVTITDALEERVLGTVEELVDQSVSDATSTLQASIQELQEQHDEDIETLNTALETNASTLREELSTSITEAISVTDAHLKEAIDAVKEYSDENDEELANAIQALSTQTTTKFTQFGEQVTSQIGTAISNATDSITAAYTKSVNDSKNELNERIDELEETHQTDIEALQESLIQNVDTINTRIDTDLNELTEDLTSLIELKDESQSQALQETEERLIAMIEQGGATNIDSITSMLDTLHSTITDEQNLAHTALEEATNRNISATVETLHEQVTEELNDALDIATDGLEEELSTLREYVDQHDSSLATSVANLTTKTEEDISTLRSETAANLDGAITGLHDSLTTEFTDSLDTISSDLNNRVTELSERHDNELAALTTKHDQDIATLEGALATGLREEASSRTTALSVLHATIAQEIQDADDEVLDEVDAKIAALQVDDKLGLLHDTVTSERIVSETVLENKLTESIEELTLKHDAELHALEVKQNQSLSELDQSLTASLQAEIENRNTALEELRQTLTEDMQEADQAVLDQVEDMLDDMHNSLRAEQSDSQDLLRTEVQGWLNNTQADLESLESRLHDADNILQNNIDTLRTYTDSALAASEGREAEARSNLETLLTNNLQDTRDELEEDYIEKIAELSATTFSQVLTEADARQQADAALREAINTSERSLIEYIDSSKEEAITLANNYTDSKTDGLNQLLGDLSDRLAYTESRIEIANHIAESMRIVLTTYQHEFLLSFDSERRFQIEVTIKDASVDITKLSLIPQASVATSTKLLVDGGLPTYIQAPLFYTESSNALKFMPSTTLLTDSTINYSFDPEHVLLTGTGIGYYIDPDTNAATSGLVTLVSGSTTKIASLEVDEGRLYTLKLDTNIPVSEENIRDLAEVNIFEVSYRPKKTAQEGA